MKEEILKLKHGECYTVPESDYGKAEIWLINDIYILYEIPLYGGEPIFQATYYLNQIDTLINNIQSWN